MSEQRNYPTRMHEVLGVEIGEKFEIPNYAGAAHVDMRGYICGVEHNDVVSGERVCEAINHGITRRPRLTHEQVEQLKALVTLGYRWLVEERNGVTVAVNHEVRKGEVKWLLIKPRDLDDVVCDVHQSLSIKGLVSWSDPEPLDIVATLKANGVEIEEDK